MPTVISRNCEHCSTEFIIKKKGQRFCNADCVVSYRRLKSKRPDNPTCLNCHTSLFYKPYNKFCSKSCAATYNNTARGPKSQTVKDNISKGVRAQLPLYSKVSWCRHCSGLIKNIWTRQCHDCDHKKQGLKCKIADTNLYPRKNHATINYAAMFMQKDSNIITYDDIDVFKNIVNNLLHVDNLSPNQIAEKFQIKHSNFGMFITKCLKLKLKDVKSAVKNTAIQKGIAVTDTKTLYYQQCEFKLSQEEMTRIPGFDLLVDHGIYHSVKNPNGMVRDHILSKSEGYQKGYDPAFISHAANCQFITNAANIKKSSSSDITYDQLQERIATWDQQTLSLPPKERRKVQKTTEHIEKIRNTINARYEKIKSGELPRLGSKFSRGGRPEKFSTKHNWAEINTVLQTVLTLSAVSKQLNISYEDLKKAKSKGLIKKPLAK